MGVFQLLPRRTAGAQQSSHVGFNLKSGSFYATELRADRAFLSWLIRQWCEAARFHVCNNTHTQI